MENSPVTAKYRVDQYDNVYDGCGMFYCKWDQLDAYEKRAVKNNPASA